jgi:hypothetical protein
MDGVAAADLDVSDGDSFMDSDSENDEVSPLETTGIETLLDGESGTATMEMELSFSAHTAMEEPDSDTVHAAAGSQHTDTTEPESIVEDLGEWTGENCSKSGRLLPEDYESVFCQKRIGCDSPIVYQIEEPKCIVGIGKLKELLGDVCR